MAGVPLSAYRCWRCVQDLGWDQFTKARGAVVMIDGNALCTEHARHIVENGVWR